MFFNIIFVSYDLPIATSLKLIYCDLHMQLHSGTIERHFTYKVLPWVIFIFIISSSFIPNYWTKSNLCSIEIVLLAFGAILPLSGSTLKSEVYWLFNMENSTSYS